MTIYFWQVKLPCYAEILAYMLRNQLENLLTLMAELDAAGPELQKIGQDIQELVIDFCAYLYRAY